MTYYKQAGFVYITYCVLNRKRIEIRKKSRRTLEVARDRNSPGAKNLWNYFLKTDRFGTYLRLRSKNIKKISGVCSFLNFSFFKMAFESAINCASTMNCNS